MIAPIYEHDFDREPTIETRPTSCQCGGMEMEIHELRELLTEARDGVGDVQMSDADIHDLTARLDAALSKPTEPR